MIRVTENFIDLNLNEEEANNFMKEVVESGVYFETDKRNGIYCIRPTNDLVCYKNYIDYLNSYYSDWKSYGYLDLGLVPILLAPSFMADSLNTQINELVKSWKIPLIQMPPVSFLRRGCLNATKDVWVKKTDLAKLLNVSEEEATLSTLLNGMMRRLDQYEIH